MAARHKKEMNADERDSFGHLILLCLAHHSAVDDPKTGERYYPADLLLEWKEKREGRDKGVLSEITVPADDPDVITRYLESVFEPPLKRLETLAESLQSTGELTEGNLAELNRIIQSMSDTPEGINRHTAVMLMDAAEMLSNMRLDSTAATLMDAAETMANLPRRPPGAEW